MISKEKEAMLKEYNSGLNAYKNREWDKAIECFQNALKIDEKDGPSEIYLERSKNYKENPPEDDWDGVFTMKTK